MPSTDRFAPNLRFKILLLFVLILVIPLSLLMVAAVKRTEDASVADFNRRLGYAAGLFRESLEDQMDSLRIRVKTVADFDFYALGQSGFEAATTRPLMQYELIRSGLDYVAIVRNGAEISLFEGTPPSESLGKIVSSVCHTPLAANLYVIGRDPWIVAAAEITKLRGKERGLRDPSQGSIHVLFALKVARDFADRLKRLTGAEFSLIYGGRRVMTTLMDLYNHRMTDSLPPQPDSRSGTMEVHGEAHSFVREEALRERISEPVFVEISLPQSEFAKLGRRITFDFTLFGVLGVLLAIITGTVLAIHIARPLNELAQTTSQVAAGDLNLTLQETRKDEIGQLQRNFITMINGLKAERDQKEGKMRELSTLFEISNAVNFLTDSEELLKFVLNKAIDIFEAERGSIMLLDDVTDELVIKVASGGRYRVAASTPVKLGSGICGTVAKEGKGRICNNGFKDPEFRNYGSLIPVEDIRSLLVAPLKFKEGTIGVINIVNKRNAGLFTEGDLSLLNLIASQAAVTIENNKLYELSITDGLTRLYVQRYFLARLSEEMLRARRYGLKLGLIMIDIDNFKHFNDVYGHQTGDQVLQRVALAIRETIRTGIDIPCRYGGEEMAVILPETRSEEALRTGERLRESIAALTLSHPMGQLKVTASLGVAAYPIDANDRDSLIMVADKAMYHSKHSGKNCTTLASDMKSG